MFWRKKPSKTEVILGLGLDQMAPPITSGHGPSYAHWPPESAQDRVIGQLIDQSDWGDLEKVAAYGSAAIQPLMMRLKVGNPRFETTLKILSRVMKKVQDSRPMPVLLEIIKVDHSSLAARCVGKMGYIGTSMKPGFKEFFESMARARLATECLGDSGDRSAVPSLKEFRQSLKSENEKVLEIQLQRGHSGGSTYPTEEESQMCRCRDGVMEEVNWALAKLGEYDLIPSIIAACYELNQKRVIETLSRVGTAAIPEVIKCLADESSRWKLIMACSVLASIGNETCIKPLLSFLCRDTTLDETREAALALARITERCAAAISEGDLRLITGQRNPSITWTSREDSDISGRTAVDLAPARAAANRELQRRGLATVP